MRRSRHAFTLIELLTVVGIIALLASLILGAVVFVRARARLLQSSNNIRQIVTAARNWAGRETIPGSSRRGFFPPGPPQIFPTDYSMGLGSQDQVTLYDGSVADPKLKPRNHGWLHQRQDLNDVDIFYNPDQESSYFSNTPDSGFLDSTGVYRWGTNAVIRSSYALRGSLQNDPNTLSLQNCRPINTEYDSSNVAAVADAFTIPNAGSPGGNEARLAHGNIRYSWGAADGSVRVFEDPGQYISNRNYNFSDFLSYEERANDVDGLPRGAWLRFAKQ